MSQTEADGDDGDDDDELGSCVWDGEALVSQRSIMPLG